MVDPFLWRINKFFSEQGICSRREADKIVEQGRVKINGRIAVLGDTLTETDAITLDDKPIATLLNKPKRLYLMYNKPQGVECTTDTRVRGNIIEAIGYSERVFPVGRLDKDSTGLIFLTNDGDVVNKILRAQFGHEKEYIVETMQPFTPDFIKALSSGVNIGDHITRPCKVWSVNKSTFHIILTEGKNHQIRRMCEALEHKVRKLQRIRIMNIQLGSLKIGEYQIIPTKLWADLEAMLSDKPQV